MKKSRDEIMQGLKAVLGENNTDEVIAILEDVSDSLDNDYSDYTEKINNLEQQLKKNDENWRKRYTERFFSAETSSQEIKEEQTEDVKEDGEMKSYDELFEEV